MDAFIDGLPHLIDDLFNPGWRLVTPFPTRSSSSQRTDVSTAMSSVPSQFSDIGASQPPLPAETDVSPELFTPSGSTVASSEELLQPMVVVNAVPTPAVADATAMQRSAQLAKRIASLRAQHAQLEKRNFREPRRLHPALAREMNLSQ